jgi:RNA polymerase sigma-70 factor, ECF subfamily
MTSSSNTERFVQQLAEQQNRLYGYVYSLVGDHSRAADVLQETNLVLWRKIDEFDSAKPFLAWAFGVARFQVLAHLRDQKRDRLLLDAELVDVISDEAERQAGQMDQLRDALRSCLETLTPSNRQLIESRYIRSMSINEIASNADRTVSAIKIALMRTRRLLADCIQLRIGRDAD